MLIISWIFFVSFTNMNRYNLENISNNDPLPFCSPKYRNSHTNKMSCFTRQMQPQLKLKQQ